VSLVLSANAAAQGCVALAPSGQPALAAIRPTCRNTVPAAVVQVAGNPAFQLHCAATAPSPAGFPIVMLIGQPVPPPLPLGVPPLHPAFGAPGWLTMHSILLVLPCGVSGTLGNPPTPLPIPGGLGPLGLALSAQMVVVLPGGLALSAATGIVI
jgi:hypothetical protein